jgi:uncharacterized protein (TIGR02646 family)
MLNIKKLKEPRALKQYRSKPDAYFDGYAGKAKLRKALIKEQHGLCAYGMCKLEAEEGDIKIEHWHGKITYPREQLSYGNLLACCSGSEGHPKKFQHCDTRKGNKDIKFNPASDDVERIISYTIDGKIVSSDPDFNNHLNDVLNLNIIKFTCARAFILRGVVRRLSTKKGTLKKKELKKYLSEWKEPGSTGLLHEYCGIAIYYLEKKIRRLCS